MNNYKFIKDKLKNNSSLLSELITLNKDDLYNVIQEAFLEHKNDLKTYIKLRICPICDDWRSVEFNSDGDYYCHRCAKMWSNIEDYNILLKYRKGLK